MSSDRLLLAAALLLAGCSVRENRADCPCALSLELLSLPVRPVVVEVTGEQGFACTEIVRADTVLRLGVPKGETEVSAVGGAVAEADGSVSIPVGEEAPPLYLFYASFPATEEQLTLPVRLHKQFCTLDLQFTGPPGYGPPFEVTVEGSFAGWRGDGSPLPGPFSRRLLPSAAGEAALRLPRQGDDSLLMHILFSDRVVRTFALGSYIAAAGYDWSAPDLGDLCLQVDISLTSVTISTDAWSETEEIELFI